ncbi:hypothetical protein [Roseomonas genomospecies 6]|uniref:hypothetical protein n=1 Tax=Roseomonas genomospecies 6 TaxID=214106 RepID=UPI0011F13CCB|nr:hypothetical protein [Roseomonas genomospecies 6]
MRQALARFFARHPGMERKLAGVLGPNRLAGAATWNDLTKVITAKDLVDQLVRIPCSSTEQTLLAAILTEPIPHRPARPTAERDSARNSSVTAGPTTA